MSLTYFDAFALQASRYSARLTAGGLASGTIETRESQDEVPELCGFASTRFETERPTAGECVQDAATDLGGVAHQLPSLS